MFRLHIRENESNASHGLGFGTTISKFLISQLGPSSSIHVDSTLNLGTKLSFYIYKNIL